MPPAHARCLAMLAPGHDDARGRPDLRARRARLLEEGDRLEQPGLVAALEVVADGGRAHVLRGDAGGGPARLMEERDGPRHARRPGCLPVCSGSRRSRRTTRACASRRAAGSRSSSTRSTALPPLRGMAPGPSGRSRLARILAAPLFSGRTYEHTTNLCVVDRGGQRLRAHDEPRARLGGLPARATTST